ncbi:unnamed protein product [Calypogeia fissa]
MALRSFSPKSTSLLGASARSLLQLQHQKSMGGGGVEVGAAVACFTSIPIIDIEPLVTTRLDVAHDIGNPKVINVVKEIDDACKNVGFFYVKGHGVPPDLLDDVREVGREFFNLPREEKHQIIMNSASGYRGYQKLGENITKGIPDLHEAIDYFKDWNGRFPESMSGHPLLGQNKWPDKPLRFQPLLQEYLQVMQDLGKVIMRGVGLALNGSIGTFEGTRAGDPFWILRMIGYPPIPDQNIYDVGCGEHTDYGLLTLVNQDDVRALQVKNQDGEWIWADPIPGTFVVNIGDMLKIWSNGIYQPTVHRVLNNESMYRVSVPFFYEPNFEAVVEPLQTCVKRTGGKSLYDPVVYGEHVTRKVLTNFG